MYRNDDVSKEYADSIHFDDFCLMFTVKRVFLHNRVIIKENYYVWKKPIKIGLNKKEDEFS